MENINNIEKYIKRLEIIWKNNPHLRLGQLISNVYQTASASSYYISNEEYLKKLEEFYKVDNRNNFKS